MIQIYACQDCDTIVLSTEEIAIKLHQNLNTCPVCKGDMCNCNACKKEALKGIKKTLEEII